MDALAEVSRLATEEFARAGVRYFEVPARQLFAHDARGALVVRPDAAANRRVLAELALAFEGCAASRSGVSLRRSLPLGADGASLLYAAGARLLCAVALAEGAPRMVALALVTSLRPAVLEVAVARTAAAAALPPRALYLELVCAAPRTGGATFLLLRLLGRRAHDGVLAHAVNKQSKALLARHGFEALDARGDVLYLSRAAAAADAARYRAMLRTADATRALCTRRGASPRTEARTYWDCR